MVLGTAEGEGPRPSGCCGAGELVPAAPPGWTWSPSARRAVALSCSSLSSLMWKGRRKCLENLRVGFKPLIPAAEARKKLCPKAPALGAAPGANRAAHKRLGLFLKRCLQFLLSPLRTTTKKMGIEKKNHDVSPGERRLSRSHRVGDSTRRVRHPATRTGLRLRGGLHGDARFKGDKMGTEPPKSPTLAPLVRWAPPPPSFFCARRCRRRWTWLQTLQRSASTNDTRRPRRRGQAAPLHRRSQEARPLPEPRVQELKPRVLLFTLRRVFLGA